MIDFDVWLEYFGLLNEDDSYDKNVVEKEEIAKKNNLKLIGVKKEDLFPVLNLDKIISKILNNKL